jgi:hypothetical protein
MTTELPPKLTYTTAEAAEIIPCRENWLIDQLRTGRFTARKIHRQWRLTMADMEAIIEACRCGPRTIEDRRRGLCTQSRKHLEQT